MKQMILGCLLVLLAASAVWAQLYPGKAEALIEPMDRAAGEAQEYYANVAIAGAEEDAKAQDVRYNEALTPMNEANERHFDATLNVVTVLNAEKK